MEISESIKEILNKLDKTKLVENSDKTILVLSNIKIFVNKLIKYLEDKFKKINTITTGSIFDRFENFIENYFNQLLEKNTPHLEPVENYEKKLIDENQIYKQKIYEDKQIMAKLYKYLSEGNILSDISLSDDIKKMLSIDMSITTIPYNKYIQKITLVYIDALKTFIYTIMNNAINKKRLQILEEIKSSLETDEDINKLETLRNKINIINKRVSLPEVIEENSGDIFELIIYSAIVYYQQIIYLKEYIDKLNELKKLILDIATEERNAKIKHRLYQKLLIINDKLESYISKMEPVKMAEERLRSANNNLNSLIQDEEQKKSDLENASNKAENARSAVNRERLSDSIKNEADKLERLAKSNNQVFDKKKFILSKELEANRNIKQLNNNEKIASDIHLRATVQVNTAKKTFKSIEAELKLLNDAAVAAKINVESEVELFNNENKGLIPYIFNINDTIENIRMLNNSYRSKMSECLLDAIELYFISRELKIDYTAIDDTAIQKIIDEILKLNSVLNKEKVYYDVSDIFDNISDISYIILMLPYIMKTPPYNTDINKHAVHTFLKNLINENQNYNFLEKITEELKKKEEIKNTEETKISIELDYFKIGEDLYELHKKTFTQEYKNFINSQIRELSSQYTSASSDKKYRLLIAILIKVFIMNNITFYDPKEKNLHEIKLQLFNFQKQSQNAVLKYFKNIKKATP